MNKIITLTCLFVLVLPLSILAQQSEVFSNKDGAIKGFDPVAFFVESKAVLGVKEFAYDWKNATWHFATKKNKDLFVANPEKYAPQYGGYCAYGIADGHKAPTETNTWTVVDNKLYFNYNLQVKKEWSKDQLNLIKKADELWPTVKKD